MKREVENIYRRYFKELRGNGQGGRKMRLEWKSCLRVAATIFLLYLAIYYWGSAMNVLGLVIGAAMPIITGFVIAYILNILMSFYEKYYFRKSKSEFVKKSKRAVCLIAAILSLVGIVVLLIHLVIPELISCIQLLISDIPPAIEALLKNETIVELLPKDIYKELAAIDWQSYISQFVQFVTSGLGSTVTTLVSAVSSVFSRVINWFIAFIFAIYFLLGKEQLVGQCKRVMNSYVPQKAVEKINYVTTVLNDCFHKYIVGQCIEAVILGGLCIFGMLIFRFPYAAMIGTLIGFTALIPVAGAYIGAIVGFIMILTVSPIKAVLFIVFIVVLQQLEGNLIYPKVVGGSLGLPAVWVLAAVTVGGSLMGIFGMLLGVPIAAALYRMLRDDVRRRECKNTGKKQEKARHKKIR